jgi:hypothetical protein
MEDFMELPPEILFRTVVTDFMELPPETLFRTVVTDFVEWNSSTQNAFSG